MANGSNQKDEKWQRCVVASAKWWWQRRREKWWRHATGSMQIDGDMMTGAAKMNRDNDHSGPQPDHIRQHLWIVYCLTYFIETWTCVEVFCFFCVLRLLEHYSERMAILGFAFPSRPRYVVHYHRPTDYLVLPVQSPGTDEQKSCTHRYSE